MSSKYYFPVAITLGVLAVASYFLLSPKKKEVCSCSRYRTYHTSAHQMT
jgi:hypothetical protein